MKIMKNKFFDFITEEKVNKNIQKTIKYNIKKILLEEVYKKIKDLLEDKNFINKVNNKTIFNSNYGIIILSIEQNKIYYSNGYLKGNFNAKLSNEIQLIGGIWDKKQKGFLINIYNIPKTIKEVIEKKERNKNEIYTFLIISMPFILKNISQKIEEISLENKFFNLIKEVDKKIEKEEIIKTLDITEYKEYKQRYTENTKLSIKNMTEKKVNKLRKDILKIIKDGGAQKEIKDILSKNYNLTINRAEFVANQEVRLALVSYQEEKFKKQNITKFFWVHTDPNGKTSRKEHIEFFRESNNGKIFDYNNLPINPKTKKEDAPGRLYNCRCVARMIIN